MAIVPATNGLTKKADWDAQRQTEARTHRNDPDVDELNLSPEEIEHYNILRYCAKTLDDGQKARKPHEIFDICWALYNGDMWNERRPNWRATITINKIRAFITFMQAIMTDNKPRISVEPRVPGSEDAADLLRKLVDRDWDENNMQGVIALWVLYGLIWGYAFIKVTYDPFADGGRGKHCVCVVPPYRVFVNRTATCIEDAEYIVHVEDVTMGWIRRNFPKKAELVSSMRGIAMVERADQDRNRDYVREGTAVQPRILSAMNINGNIVSPQAPMTHPNYLDEERDTVEVCEYWLRDETREPYERQVVENGQGKFEPVVEHGETVMEIVGTKTVISEVTGIPTIVPMRAPKMKPVMETAWREKFPNGRLVMIAAGRVLLRDIPNPYQIDGFPFAMWKDYDVGGFHGQGEPLALRSMAIAINKLVSQVFEILEKTGNPSWKLKKGGGVNAASIKNKPGLVIAMDEITNLQPLEKPPIPQEFFALYKLVAEGMGEVSGINDAVRGAMPAAGAAFATMDQLTEAGSAPIRQKVRNLESGLARFGRLRIALIQQYDQGHRPLRVSTDDLAPGVVQPAGSVTVEFREYKNVDLQGQVEFNIVPVSSLSTSPQGLWNRWMSMLEKKLIDPPWWHSKFRIEGWKTELPRMIKQQEKDAAMEAAAKRASKVGGNKSSPARSAAQSRRAPPSNIPSRESNAMMR